MDFLERFKTAKQKGAERHRPCYPVPQYMSKQEAQNINTTRAELQMAYNREMAKPISERNTKLAYEMDLQLYPRLCGW